MALSGSLTTNAYAGARSLTLTWSATQSLGGNTSTISWTLSGSGSGGGYYVSGNFKVVIDGAVVYSSAARIELWNGTVVATGSHTVSHNQDGAKSFAIRIEGGIYNIAVNCTAQQTFQLDAIPRAAMLTGATNFTDEENPSIFFYNPLGNAAVLQAFIGFDSDGGLATIYRTNGEVQEYGTASTYTFGLEPSEREALQQKCKHANSTRVWFMLRTIIGGAQYDSEKVYATLHIVNAQPTLASSVSFSYDNTWLTSPATLVGSSGNVIRGVTKATVTFGDTTKKFATLVGASATCGSQSRDSSGMFPLPLDRGEFRFWVQDSRGNVAQKTITRTLVEYSKPTCSMADGNPNATGAYTFRVSGSFFNGSFGAVSNTLTVQYRYRVEGGTYSAYKTMTVSKSGTSYTATASITGLDYTKPYQFQAKVRDKLSEVTTGEKTVRSTPVFDFDGTGFNVNGVFSVNGTKLLDLIYPVGSIYISTANKSPGVFLGGSWTPIHGRFLLAEGRNEANTDNSWGTCPAGSISATAGKLGGEATHTLQLHEMPSHNHSANSLGVSSGVLDSASSGWAAMRSAERSNHQGTTEYVRSTGGSQPHGNMPPYLAVYMWKRTA